MEIRTAVLPFLAFVGSLCVAHIFGLPLPLPLGFPFDDEGL